jgi:putative PIN family toxin of toxin-antitoxin system
MIRVVLDTNVVVSAVLSVDGPSKVIFDMAVNERFAWFVTEPILAEYQKVLAYPRLKISSANARRTMVAVKTYARLVESPHRVTDSADEADNRFLECAETAKANYLVTGNLKHFPRARKYTKVVSPADFLLHWQVEQPLNPAR